MFFYYAIIIIASAVAGIANTQKKVNKSVTSLLFFLSALVMLLPLAMRGIGVDYDVYVGGYNATSVNWADYWRNYSWRPEPLYAFLNYLARWLFNGFQGVNILCAIISIGFTFAGLYKFKEKINLGTAVWSFGFIYYIMMFGLNRMMIAVSIITWGWQYYFSKSTKKLFAWTVVAGLFHYSAFLMIPFYCILKWVEKKKITIKDINWYKVIIAVSIVFLLIYIIIPVVFGGFSWYNRYSSYFNLTFNPSALNNNAATYLLIVLVVVYKRSLLNYLDEYKSMIAIMVLYVVLSLACMIMPIHRITYYFYPICVLLYSAIPPSGVLTGNNKAHRTIASILFLLIILCMGVLWIFQFMKSDLWGEIIVPYKIGLFNN